jgi:hypothetical protein
LFCVWIYQNTKCDVCDKTGKCGEGMGLMYRRRS